MPHFLDDLVIYVEVKLGNYREIIQLQLNKSMTASARDKGLISTKYYSRQFTFLEHEDIVEGISFYFNPKENLGSIYFIDRDVDKSLKLFKASQIQDHSSKIQYKVQTVAEVYQRDYKEGGNYSIYPDPSSAHEYYMNKHSRVVFFDMASEKLFEFTPNQSSTFYHMIEWVGFDLNIKKWCVWAKSKDPNAADWESLIYLQEETDLND